MMSPTEHFNRLDFDFELALRIMKVIGIEWYNSAVGYYTPSLSSLEEFCHTICLDAINSKSTVSKNCFVAKYDNENGLTLSFIPLEESSL